jgi:predicted O-methyltransferase YrrM
MNNYFKYWKETLNTQKSRDPIFLDVLSRFNNKPINILEIGCARDLNLQARFGDGWSSLFWADYILEYGGSLTSYDIDQSAIDRVNALLENIDIQFSSVVADGTEILKVNNKYDLIYLDGSDSPYEMLEQMKLCDLVNSYVLCDDFHQKGILVHNNYPVHTLYQLKNNHQMALFHHSIKNLNTIFYDIPTDT